VYITSESSLFLLTDVTIDVRFYKNTR